MADSFLEPIYILPSHKLEERPISIGSGESNSIDKMNVNSNIDWKTISQKTRGLAQVNRLPETISYNIIYAVIGINIATDQPISDVQGYINNLMILFVAMMMLKMQASVADALHGTV